MVDAFSGGVRHESEELLHGLPLLGGLGLAEGKQVRLLLDLALGVGRVVDTCSIFRGRRGLIHAVYLF